MMQVIFKRIFHFQEMILLLSLTVLACLPIALSNLVRDASLSLLLPTTLIGTLLTWLLATKQNRKSTSITFLLLIGFLLLFIRVGQIGSPIIELLKQTFNLFPKIYSLLRFDTPVDSSLFVFSANDLAQQTFTIASRFTLWLASLFQKTRIEDPAARTLAWGIGLWLVAIWAGWQIYRNKRLLLGILPSTILLAIVLNYTGREIEILWFHLTLLIFLIGFYSYANTQKHWDESKIDYADSTSLDTLVLVGVLTLVVIVFSYVTSTFSVKDFLENLREKRATSNSTDTTNGEALGLEPARDDGTVPSSFGGLPRSHLIGAGPELSTQLIMTIKTGDLPPMSLNSQVPVPRYYWRTQTYQIYTSSGWANPQTTSDEIISQQNLFQTQEENIRLVNQDVILANESERLFWSGVLLNADIPFQAVWNHKSDSAPQTTPRLDTDLLAALAPVQSYQAESILLTVKADYLRKSSSVYPAWVQKQFLTLPEAVPERVLSLARDLTASKSNPYDRAIAIQNYLRQFPYTLEVPAPPSGRDVADYFLFDLQQGYCDYYATTMVVLARAAGLPARLVIGYANGTYNLETAEYIVTENYAHSWVEIYFTNIGWVEFEPTANQATFSYGEIGSSVIPEQALPEDNSFAKQVKVFFANLLAKLWILFIVVAILLFAWFGWSELKITRLNPAEKIQYIFKQLRRLAQPISGISPLNQTANQYAFNLTEKLSLLKTSPQTQSMFSPAMYEIQELTDLYSRSLFAPNIPSHAESFLAMKVWSRLRWRLIVARIIILRKKIFPIPLETVENVASNSQHDPKV